MGINYENGLTTLSIGKDRISEWAYQPACYLVVPNNDSLKCRQNLTSLPQGAVSVERVYGVRDNSKALFRQTKAPARSYADQPKNRQLFIQRDESDRKNYVQTNEQGYITGVVKESLLVGLHGGTRSMIVNDEQAADITELLKISRKKGEGLHIDELCINPIAQFNSKN